MTFMHKFAYSFFDFAAYKEFLVQGFGKSILYLFLITLIFSTISTITTITTLTSEISTLENSLRNNAPNFELKNGLLSVASNDPVYYRHNGEILIVDTSGKTNKSISDSYSNSIYIDSNEITIRQNYRTLQTIKFTDFTELNLNNKTLQVSLSIIKIIFPIILLIFNPLISFLLNSISVFLVIAPLSLNISSLMGVKLKYPKACILSFYAMTLPLLLESLVNVSGIDLPGFYIIFYIVALVYCGLAIRKIKNTDKSALNIMK